MVTAVTVRSRKASLCRFALRLDAAATAISGLILVVAAGSIAELFEVESAWLVATIGFGFFWPSAAWMTWASSRVPMTSPLLLVPMLFNIAWVLVSAMVLTMDMREIPPGGRWLLAVAAGIVAVLAGVEWAAWRQLRS